MKKTRARSSSRRSSKKLIGMRQVCLRVSKTWRARELAVRGQQGEKKAVAGSWRWAVRWWTRAFWTSPGLGLRTEPSRECELPRCLRPKSADSGAGVATAVGPRAWALHRPPHRTNLDRQMHSEQTLFYHLYQEASVNITTEAATFWRDRACDLSCYAESPRRRQSVSCSFAFEPKFWGR